MSTIIEYNQISKSYGKNDVLTQLDLAIPSDDFMVIYGLPSSGKSVLLRLLMGLEKPDSGSIRLRGQDITGRSPKERNLGYVPQDFALFPQKSIYENIAYPLRVMRQPDREIDETVLRAARMLSIQDLLQKLPTQLSGGQKQRVAIARGIVKNTDIYVFDDPLAGLDFKLREKLFDDLKQLQKMLGATFVYTTSDSIETMSLATTVAVLHETAIREVGSPESIYLDPKTRASMSIFGFPTANVTPGMLVYEQGELWCKTDLYRFPVSPDFPDSELQENTRVEVGLRPERIQADTNGEAVVEAEVFLREDLGAEEIIYINVGGIEWTMLQTAVNRIPYEQGQAIRVGFDSDALFVFNAENGNRIGKGKGTIHV